MIRWSIPSSAQRVSADAPKPHALLLSPSPLPPPLLSAAHQFHTNDVIKRPVPPSYTKDLYEAQEAAGRLDGHGCMDPPIPSMIALLLWPCLLALPVGSGLLLAVHFAEQQKERRQAAAKEGVAIGGRVAAEVEASAVEGAALA